MKLSWYNYQLTMSHGIKCLRNYRTKLCIKSGYFIKFHWILFDVALLEIMLWNSPLKLALYISISWAMTLQYDFWPIIRIFLFHVHSNIKPSLDIQFSCYNKLDSYDILSTYPLSTIQDKIWELFGRLFVKISFAPSKKPQTELF